MAANCLGDGGRQLPEKYDRSNESGRTAADNDADLSISCCDGTPVNQGGVPGEAGVEEPDGLDLPLSESFKEEPRLRARGPSRGGDGCRP